MLNHDHVFVTNHEHELHDGKGNMNSYEIMNMEVMIKYVMNHEYHES